MNNKPRLIDLDFLKKVSKSNIEKIPPSVTTK